MASFINDENDEMGVEKSGVDNQILEYLHTIKKIKAGQMEIPKPTPYRISTISAKCRLTGEINIQELYLLVRKQVEEKIMKQQETDYFIQGIQYGSNIVGLFKNLQKKLDKIQGKLNDKDYKNIDFYNQCTLLLYSDYNNNQINLKVFCNGSITMTGCKDENDGVYVIKKLISELKKHSQIFMYDEDQGDISMDNFGITMINSDYFVGFRLDLIKLEEVLVNKYGLFFSYDPKFYAAVKISFMWNEEAEINNGICQCEKKCIVSKKKTIKSKNKCSIITIAVFNSGKIIITGSNTIEKTRAAYKFINNILKESYADIVKLSIHDCFNLNDKKKIRKGRPPKKLTI
jgi:TATA-box binding protein (TBP) (component of TFIID and TFIIIB)